MAFTILREEQLLLLTDNQIKQYEKELDLHKKRVAFVEQLEKFENAEFKPYTPKLHKIIVIDKMEPREFHKQEYKARLREPVKKPAVHVNPVEITKPYLAELPAVFVHPIQVVPVQIENKQPILPTVAKPAVLAKNVKIAKTVKPGLPVLAKPELAVASFKQPDMSSIDLPLIKTPDIESILSTNGYKLETRRAPGNLPSIMSPNIAVPAFKRQKKEIKGLPEVALAAPAIRPFNRPEHKAAELPAFPESKITFKPIRIERTSMRQLPQTRSANVSVKAYSQPGTPMSSLPAVARPDIAAVSFQPPVVSGVNLPAAGIKPPFLKETRPIRPRVYTVTAPEVQAVVVKPFPGLKHKAAELPILDKTTMPDVRKALDQFFSASNSKKESEAGQNV
jgi:hypothetical protein